MSGYLMCFKEGESGIKGNWYLFWFKRMELVGYFSEVVCKSFSYFKVSFTLEQEKDVVRLWPGGGLVGLNIFEIRSVGIHENQRET